MPVANILSDKTIVSTLTHTLADVHTRTRLGTIEASSRMKEAGFSIVDVDVSDINAYVVPKVTHFLSISAYDTFRVAIEDTITGDINLIFCDKLFTFHGHCSAIFRIDREIGQDMLRCSVVYS